METCPDCEKYREGLRKAACALVDLTTVAKRSEGALEGLLDLLGDPPVAAIEKFVATKLSPGLYRYQMVVTPREDWALLIQYLERHHTYIFRSKHGDDVELTKQIAACLSLLRGFEKEGAAEGADEPARGDGVAVGP